MENYTTPQEEALFPVKYKKTRLNYSVREDLAHDFKIYTDKHRLNKSAIVERLLEQYLIKVGVRKA